MADSPTEKVGRLGWVQVDSVDPEALARFWSAVLGVGIRGRLGDPPQYVICEPESDGAPKLCFQRVPEAASGKNRLHLDVAVPDVDAATTRVLALGGRQVPDGDVVEHDMSWRVMADPEGNVFCLIPSE
jgi:predicted enzyme related to lactoylglutathione lyase